MSNEKISVKAKLIAEEEAEAEKKYAGVDQQQ